LFECVVNVSEGWRLDVLDELSQAAGPSLRDRHADAAHARSVFTLIHHHDELRRDVHSLIEAALTRIDLRNQWGVHPRLGVVDVVPYVALDDWRADEALGLRNETAAWMGNTLEVPVFLYGPLRDGSIRTLPEVRKHAFGALAPDFGPLEASVEHGASAVGARGLLVAWNIWVRGISLDEGKRVAKAIRSREVRALAFPIKEFVQISCNLIEPFSVGPAHVYDQVRALLGGGEIERCELVGLVPEEIVTTTDRARWEQLGLSLESTIEARLA
jgi:glutamate formiminotransferase